MNVLVSNVFSHAEPKPNAWLLARTRWFKSLVNYDGHPA